MHEWSQICPKSVPNQKSSAHQVSLLRIFWNQSDSYVARLTEKDRKHKIITKLRGPIISLVPKLHSSWHFTNSHIPTYHLLKCKNTWNVTLENLSFIIFMVATVILGRPEFADALQLPVKKRYLGWLGCGPQVTRYLSLALENRGCACVRRLHAMATYVYIAYLFLPVAPKEKKQVPARSFFHSIALSYWKGTPPPPTRVGYLPPTKMEASQRQCFLAPGRSTKFLQFYPNFIPIIRNHVSVSSSVINPYRCVTSYLEITKVHMDRTCIRSWINGTWCREQRIGTWYTVVGIRWRGEYDVLSPERKEVAIERLSGAAKCSVLAYIPHTPNLRLPLINISRDVAISYQCQKVID